MRNVKSIIGLTVFLLNYMCSLLLLVFKTILREVGMIFPYEKIDDKNADNNRPRRFKTYIVVSVVLASIPMRYSLFETSKHMIVALDILFFFSLLIPFLFKTYSKYLPAVN